MSNEAAHTQSLMHMAISCLAVLVMGKKTMVALIDSGRNEGGTEILGCFTRGRSCST